MEEEVGSIREEERWHIEGTHQEWPQFLVLLASNRNDELKPSIVKCSGGVVWDELKKQCWIAGPMIAMNLLQYSWQVTSLLLVGNLGELALPSASIATAFISAIGFSMMMGMASALETICGQAYGVEQYYMLGIKMQIGSVTKGLPWKNSLSYQLEAALLASYIKFSPSCKRTRTPFPRETLYNVRNFLNLDVPSVVMICLEYWSVEMLVLLSGLLPNPKLEIVFFVVVFLQSNPLCAWSLPLLNVGRSPSPGAPASSLLPLIVAVGYQVHYGPVNTTATLHFRRGAQWRFLVSTSGMEDSGTPHYAVEVALKFEHGSNKICRLLRRTIASTDGGMHSRRIDFHFGEDAFERICSR
eukprot:Gb_06416 [translate_table: standard]